jgi:phage replication-related protein YjqB (UPF0714/DUF867 family)
VQARRFDRPGGPETLSELLAIPGVREEVVLRSRFGFMAIHGGDLELMTETIASEAARLAGASYYGVVYPEGLDRHLASSRYRIDESSALRAFLEHAGPVVSIHGYGREGRWTSLLLGGLNRTLAITLADELRPRLPGYDVVTDLADIPIELRGSNPHNPVNVPVEGGVQVELPPRVRGISPLSPPAGDDGFSPPTRQLIDGLAAVARTWVERERAISTPG